MDRGTGSPMIYLEPDPEYSLLDSAADSVRFAVSRCLTEYHGHACATSSFVNPEGEVMAWHDFGLIEGPGWAANAMGGAYELLLWARHTDDELLRAKALSIADHVLDDGFIDADTGLLYGYRKVDTDERLLNYEKTNDWLCAGSMARVASQMLWMAGLCRDEYRAPRLVRAAQGIMGWIAQHVAPLGNGWYPRRVRPDGRPYREDDPIFDHSGDGLLIMALMADLTQRGLADHRAELARRMVAFVRAGGMYGSINHDTYDSHECVAYAVAFRTLLRCARLLGRDDLKAFAFDNALTGLRGFQMARDLNGVATKGLLYMEASWDTAYLWENAEAALAFVDAAEELEAAEPREAERCRRTALTIVRAVAKHHYGPYGFLTEGVDWNNHVGQQHHIGGAEFGAIQYTEPFLNNLHIVEPTLRLVGVGV